MFCSSEKIKCRFEDIRTVAVLAVLTHPVFYKDDKTHFENNIFDLHLRLIGFGQISNETFQKTFLHCFDKILKKDLRWSITKRLEFLEEDDLREAEFGIIKLHRQHIEFLTELIYRKISGRDGSYGGYAIDFYRTSRNLLNWSSSNERIVSDNEGDVLVFENGVI